VKDRPLVVEIVGAWGAGKGTLLHCLSAADPSLRIDIDVWHLPRPLLVRGALEAGRTIAGLFANARKLLWNEAKLIIKLRAIQRQLRDPRLVAHSAIVLDEGPVFALSGLHLSGHRAVGNGGLAAWWPRTLRQWAESVDIVVHLDAPDTVLARRIRERPRFHPLQQSGDVEMFDTLRRYRSACERVLMGLTAYGGPSVMTFRTDQQTTAQIAQQVLAAIARTRNGR
jgi:shikimate kinase